MKKSLFYTLLAVLVSLSMLFSFVGCDQKPQEAAKDAADQAADAANDAADAAKDAADAAADAAKDTADQAADAAEDAADAAADAADAAEDAADAAASPELPGESGFNEIEIGELQIVGPFQVQLVYFQGVDMIPAGKQPSAEESDMHLEADIHLTPEAAPKYGFGAGEDIWPAYLTVDYKIMSEDGKTEITSGSMMPMNADDGPHYGINIKKGLIPVGKYQIILEFRPSDDYLLHVDSETGVPLAQDKGLDAAATYYEQQTLTVEWNYTAEQLESK